MYHFPLVLQCIYGRSEERGENGDGRRGVRFKEEGREWRLPVLLYAGDLVLCGESEEDLRRWCNVFRSCVEEEFCK